MKHVKALLFLLALGALSAKCTDNQSNMEKVKPMENMETTTNQAASGSEIDTATFGTGCFWCSEALFENLKGVLSVTAGYSGGHVPHPTYEQVCSDSTGHAEVIQITYNPKIISYPDLLEAFWSSHDPTTLNRQGNDVGSQYRSVIFYHSDRQRQQAEAYKEQLDKSGAFSRPIVTQIVPFTHFYKAEGYHQKYYDHNGNAPYCQYVIRPKLEKFNAKFKDKLK